MKIFPLFFMVIFLTLSCNTAETNQSSKTANTAPTIKKETSTSITTNNLAQKVVDVTYQNCTVYAGSTDFLFKRKDKEQLTIRVSHFPEENQKLKYPDFLVDQSKDLEGPAGPNTTLVGKNFQLVYVEDQVVAILR